MKALLKTREQLIEEGFKYGYPHVYLGDKRNPDARIKQNLVDLYAGTEVEIVEIEPDDGTLSFIGSSGKVVTLQHWAFVDGTKLLRFMKKPKVLKILVNDEMKAAKFYQGIGFKFPCSFSELNVDQAVKVANWILASAKKG